jgi:hypothetical protein
MTGTTNFLLSLPIVTAGPSVGGDAEFLGFVGTFAAVFLIVGFAVAAAAWTIRQDV